MNTISKILLGTAILALGACSADEPTPAPGPDVPTDGKSTMFIDVNITSNATGRGTDGGWQHGIESEHEVKNAYFYFFDKDGRFVTQATVWTGGDETEGTNTNVEYLGNNTLILRGLNKDALPKYLITILNKPDDFEPANTIEATAEKLVGITTTDAGGNKLFVMSTSSFGATQDAINAGLYDKKYPYANKLKDENFRTEEGTSEGFDANRVNIYVERLAAKFSLSIASNTDVFPVEVTIAGEINDQVESAPSGHTKLYVKIHGYGLTGTEKQSYISKKIDGFFDKAPFTANGAIPNWCDCSNFRSYWGQSVHYGKQISINDANEFTLDYTTYEEAMVKPGTPIYSTENTNIADNIRVDATKTSGLVPAKVTCLILTAQVFTDQACTSPLELVDFNNTYFTRPQFRKYVLQRLTDGGGLNYYKRKQLADTGTEGDPVTHHYEYTQISADDIELVDGDDATTGFVIAKCKKSLEGVDLYQKLPDGKWSDTPIADAIAKIEAEMLKVVNTETTRANLFKDGKMFYSVPIEHLNETRTDEEKAKYLVKDEANYGVVRNHWYNVRINKIMRLGQGIYDPDGGEEHDPEPIIPENPENERFAVGAQINILSWKIVNIEQDL